MSPREHITVVIVDDHPLFRQGLRQAIESDTRFEIAGEAGDGQSALELILRKKPDVAVLDVNLPNMGGLEVIDALRSKWTSTRIVILTMLKDEQAFNAALNLKVRGYVLKESAAAEILACLNTVAGGNSYVSASLTDFLLNRRNQVENLRSKLPRLEDLTIAERRILKRISEGKTTKQIAAEFSISPRTVESHRSNICSKLTLTGSNRLLQFALQNRDSLNHLD